MDQYTLFVLLSPFGGSIAIAIAIFCLRRRDTPAARPLGLTMIAVAAYLLFNTLELVDPSAKGTLFFAQVCYLCISFLTINWLAFALVFSNHEKWLKSVYFRLLWVVPAITAILVFTNSYHHLIWKEYSFIPLNNGYLFMKVAVYGGMFWVFWLQAYFLIVSSALLLLWSSFTVHKQFRKQAALTVIAALLPLTVNLVYVLHLIPGFVKDYSSLSYAFSGILLAISIFYYRLLDLTPFARTVLIDNMNDAMLTFDTLKRVVDFNPAAKQLFLSAGVHFLEMGAAFPTLNPYFDQLDAISPNDLLQTEINLTQLGDENYYDLQVRRLRDKTSKGVVGYIVLLHTITEHKKLLQKVRKLAEEDSLTGVLNRNRFVELAQSEIEHAQSSLFRISILMIDIDFFKRINDSLGHIGGDRLLKAFVKRLNELLRSEDLIGRIGGDEFIVLLPDSAVDQAKQLADRLCSQITATPLKIEGQDPILITVSIGVAEYIKSNSETLERVIIEADKALYQAKETGRNRACLYDPTIKMNW